MGKKSAYLKALFAFFIWSLLGPVLNLSSFTAFQNVVVQNTVGIITVLVILFYKKKLSSLTKIHFSKRIALFALTAGMVTLLVFEGLTLIPIATGFLILNMSPIIALLIEIFVFKEKLKPMRAIAIGGGLLGIVVLFSQHVLGSGTIYYVGILLMMIATCSAVIRDFNGKEINKTYSVEIVIFIILVSGLVMSLPFAFHTPWKFTTYSLLASVILGIFSAVVCTYLYFVALKSLRVSTNSLLGYSQPIFASIWGVLFLSQAISPQMIVGGLIILFSAFLAVKSEE